VQLYADAVELGVDADLVELRDRLVDRPRSRREHGQQRPADLQRERRQRRRAATQRGLRHGRDRPGEHRRPPHVRRGDVGRFRDRVEHHALERALPQLARHQPAQEPLLVGGRRGEQVVHAPASLARRPGAGQLRDGGEHAVHLADGERRRGRRCRRLAQRGPADTGTPLPQLAGQPRDDHRGLVRTGGPQQGSDPLDLSATRRGGGDVAGRRDHVREQHRAIVAADPAASRSDRFVTNRRFA
jgi:hypothetical protein